MMSTVPATISVSRFDGRAVQTDHYRDLEHLLASLLMNSGDKIPYLVRDKLLPPAIEAWDKNKARPDRVCNRHSDCAAADAAYLESHKDEQSVPLNFHCHDEDCEDCFGR